MDKAVASFWQMEENIIYRYKKDSKDKKAVNIRPGVYTITLKAEEGTDRKHAVLDIIVQSGNDGNIRPEEVAYGLMNAGMPYKAVPILIKTQGNIINAEDIMNVWKDLETVVCRTNTGMPEELPTFGKAFPTENQLPSDDVFAKITALLS